MSYHDVKCVICGDTVNPYNKGNFISHAVRHGDKAALCDARKKPECARARKSQLQRERRQVRRIKASGEIVKQRRNPEIGARAYRGRDGWRKVVMELPVRHTRSTMPQPCPSTVRYRGELIRCQDSEGHKACHYNLNIIWTSKGEARRRKHASK